MYCISLCPIPDREQRSTWIKLVPDSLTIMPAVLFPAADAAWQCRRPETFLWKVFLFFRKVFSCLFLTPSASRSIIAKRVDSGYRFRQASENSGILAQLGEHLPYKQGVTGSSPVGPISFSESYGGVAQLARAHGSYPWCQEFESPLRYWLPCECVLKDAVCKVFFCSFLLCPVCNRLS